MRLDNSGGSAVELADVSNNCSSGARGGSSQLTPSLLSLSTANTRAATAVSVAPVSVDAETCVSASVIAAGTNNNLSDRCGDNYVDANSDSSSSTNGTSYLASYVTLPRRKPYLNLKSVTTGSGSSVVNIYSSGTNLSENTAAESDFEVSSCRETLGSKFNGVNIKRAHSFKEGLDDTRDAIPTRAFPLLRTQSYHDGLAGDLGDHHVHIKPSLSRAPSIDEILESVKNLRAKKTMVKSTPDLYQNPCEVTNHHTSSMSRNKSSKGSKSRTAGPSGIIGVRYSSKSSDHAYDRVPEPHYEQIVENGDPCYENLRKETLYENINNKKTEVIYDRPKSNRLVEHQYDQVQSDLHYENVQNYDLPVYENVTDSEPTYMNVKNTNSTSRSKKSKSNKDGKSDAHKSNKSQNKSSSNRNDSDGQTYDVPRSATHIYDTPKKYSRSVESSGNPSVYATPKNNRSVVMNSVDIVQQLAKQDQKQKIDDIFADVDRDSLDGDYQPNIPPPGKNLLYRKRPHHILLKAWLYKHC